jgi:alpha-tubulin suppressor-like RCC1 family protein
VGLNGINVVGVSVGSDHTLSLAADGSVYAFGIIEALGIVWRLGGQEHAEGAEGNPVADEMTGQVMIQGNRIQNTPAKIPGLVCFVPRAH